jgi:enamine deaminase RidA (YjgF/YER057c/UK114 family)
MKSIRLFLTAFAFILSGMKTPSAAQKITNPPALFDPSPYAFSHVVSAPVNASYLLFIAGQGGEENKEGKLTPDFRTQIKHSLNNIKLALTSQSASMNDILKVTTLVVDHDEEKLKIIVEEFSKVWPEKNFPVNTLIPVPKLAIEGMLVEIDAIAIKR